MIISRQSSGAYTVDSVKDCRPSLAAAKIRFYGRSDLVAVEVGVQRGSNSERIRAILKPAHLILVDFWDPSWTDVGEEYMNAEADFQYVSGLFNKDPRVTILRDDSMRVLPKLKSDSVDYLYVDGGHLEEVCTQDILNGIRLVKIGGVLGGHDYGDPHQTPGRPYTVEPRVGAGCVDAAVGNIFNGWPIFAEAGDWWVIMDERIKVRGLEFTNSIQECPLQFA